MDIPLWVGVSAAAWTAAVAALTLVMSGATRAETDPVTKSFPVTYCDGRPMTPAEAALLSKKALQARYCDSVTGARQWQALIDGARFAADKDVVEHDRCAAAADNIKRLYKERFDHLPGKCK